MGEEVKEADIFWLGASRGGDRGRLVEDVRPESCWGRGLKFSLGYVCLVCTYVLGSINHIYLQQRFGDSENGPLLLCSRDEPRMVAAFGG
jgi:hypothetical protein